jgi:hypothetical protein
MPSNGAQVTLVNDQPAFEKLFSSPLSEPGYAERIVFDKGNGVYSYFTPLPNFGISPSERAVVSRLKLQLNNASGGFFSSLTSSTTLASVFGKEGGATYPDIANVGDGSGRVYGTGYTLNFDRALASASTSVYGVRNVVSSISEKDLLTGLNSSANWTCPASFRMKVVKAEDRFKMAHFRLNNVEGVPKTICPHQPLSGLYLPNGQPDPVAFAKLRIIERVLPQSDWDINVTDNCVVPRNPSCYEDESDTVVYDESFFTTTDTTAVPPRYSGCNVGTQFDCPHYVTICYRTDL